MELYYINNNKDNNGNNEVHTNSCYYLKLVNSKTYLGYFNNGIEAVKKAISEGYDKADGCAYCSPEAHKE